MSIFTSLQVDSAFSYLVAVVLPALDAIVPVVPSETAVIALGVATAGSADPRIALLVACAAAGAFLGDNLSYLLGRRFGPVVERRYRGRPADRVPPPTGGHGFTPDRLSPTTPARISAIDTSFTVETVSPSMTMPTVAAPAAPIPVQTA